MRRSRSLGAVVWLAGVLASGCAAHGSLGGADHRNGVFLEPSIDRSTISVRRIAVVPNRLPNNLVEAERWRRSNFEIVRRELSRNGFDVVDYASTVSAFERSGLPTEDTRASRDKYAELCQQLGVDAVFVPYYGTQAASTGVFVVNSFNYSSIVTFQVFLAERNDFLARIDSTATTGYVTGIATAIGIIVGAGLSIGAAGAGLGGSGSAAGGLGLASSIVSVSMPVLDAIISGILAAGAPDSYWEKSFDEAIRTGLRPFLAAIRPGAGQGGRGPSMPTYGAQPYGAPPYAPQPPAPQPSSRPAATPRSAQPPAQPYAQPSAQPPAQPYAQPPAQPYAQPPALAPAPRVAPPPPAPYPAPQALPAPPQSYPLPAVPMPGGCASTAECRTGRVCIQGQCVSPPEAPAGGPGCRSDAECKGGRACVQGACVSR